MNIFNKSLLKFKRPSESSVFNCANARRVKLLTRLSLGLSHLHEHKFKLNSLNSICSCVNDIKTSVNFLHHSPHYSNERPTFLNTIGNINRNIFDKNDLQIAEILLHGDSFLDEKRSNTLILNASLDFLFVMKRFDVIVL